MGAAGRRQRATQRVCGPDVRGLPPHRTTAGLLGGRRLRHFAARDGDHRALAQPEQSERPIARSARVPHALLPERPLRESSGASAALGLLRHKWLHYWKRRSRAPRAEARGSNLTLWTALKARLRRAPPRAANV